MWSTPSSRNAHVVARSADAAGIGGPEFEPDMMVVVVVQSTEGSPNAR